MAEELFDQSVKKDVLLIPADVPDLFQHDQTPAQKYVRRVICATTELERDLTVQRLRDGIQRKMKSTKAKTQLGQPKVTGAKTLLELAKPSPKVLQVMKDFCNKHKKSRGEIGLRALARQLSHELRLPRCMGHETARRICNSLLKAR